jgi:hypothetical protein
MVGWRAVKETTGFSTPEIDPDFNVACEHVDLLLKRFHTYSRDVRALTEAFLACGDSGMDICHSLATAVQGMDGCGPVATAFTLRDFLAGVDDAIRHKFLVGVNNGVLEVLESHKQQFRGLKSLMNHRTRTRRLCDSLKESLDAATTKGRADDIPAARAELDRRQRELREVTNTFKARVAALWDLRFFIFEQPMTLLVGFLFQLARQTFDHLAALQGSVDPGCLRCDFLLEEGAAALIAVPDSVTDPAPLPVLSEDAPALPAEHAAIPDAAAQAAEEDPAVPE